MKTILVDAVHTFVIKDKGLFKEMYELLEKYPNRKIVLTGANDEQYKQFGLDQVPYELFTLQHKPEKTDPRYYELMLAKYNLDKNDVIYFEHDLEVVKSAQSVGIKTYYYDSVKQDLEALKYFIDANL